MTNYAGFVLRGSIYPIRPIRPGAEPVTNYTGWDAGTLLVAVQARHSYLELRMAISQAIENIVE